MVPDAPVTACEQEHPSSINEEVLIPMQVTNLVGQLPRHAVRRPATRNHKQIKYIAVHHVGAGEASVNATPLSIARYHIGPNHISKRGCPTVCYALMIDSRGNIYKTEDFTTVTWHVNALYNKGALGVLLLDDLDVHVPTQEMLQALEWLVLEYIPSILPHIKYTGIKGHREFTGVHKSCPGKNITLRPLRLKYLAKYGQ